MSQETSIGSGGSRDIQSQPKRNKDGDSLCSGHENLKSVEVRIAADNYRMVKAHLILIANKECIGIWKRKGEPFKYHSF